MEQQKKYGSRTSYSSYGSSSRSNSLPLSLSTSSGSSSPNRQVSPTSPGDTATFSYGATRMDSPEPLEEEAKSTAPQDQQTESKKRKLPENDELEALKQLAAKKKKIAHTPEKKAENARITEARKKCDELGIKYED